MHLIHQRDADAFLGDPFASVPDLFDELKLPYASSFSDIENEFEATRVQADIAGETIQWLTSEIRLPSYGANLQNIVNAWNTLAAHRKTPIPMRISRTAHGLTKPQRYQPALSSACSSAEWPASRPSRSADRTDQAGRSSRQTLAGSASPHHGGSREGKRPASAAAFPPRPDRCHVTRLYQI